MSLNIVNRYEKIVQFITYMFLHSNFLCMYKYVFLYIFGKIIEYKIGVMSFICLYFIFDVATVIAGAFFRA